MSTIIGPSTSSVPPCVSHVRRATAMWHWHDARYPRDNPGRGSAENDSVERGGTGSFLNPQNFAITIGKPLVLNQYGLVVAWACATAHVADNTFQWVIRQFEERMIVLSDTGFHAAEGDPANLKLCQRGAWEERMLVETVLSMLTLVCHFKKVMH